MNITNYLNRPWKSGEADCWTLVRDIYKNELNIELPRIIIDASDPRAVLKAFSDPEHLKPWHPIDKPEHLCIVFFASRVRSSHVAVYLDINGGCYLHSYKGAGSVCDSVFDFGLSGFQTPEYKKHLSRI